LRLELLTKAKSTTAEEPLSYEPEKMIGVIKLAAEKSGWRNRGDRHLGFCAYYSHNTYVAEVAEVVRVDNEPRIKKVYCAIDCGIVINPKAALNQIEGGIIDGIGHAMYGDFSFKNGRGESDNFNQFRLIRISEVPEIEVHFVESFNDPTGLGEPTLPPAGGAIANALYSATGKRFYKQPFVKEMEVLG
jgi:isoquinoline 1-oxidoreductase beta subunit